MDKVYGKFADVYDRMGADRHSQHMVEYCKKIFDQFSITPQNGLDLCCGTGTAIKLLSDLGIEMSGLDQSPKMLAQAAQKLKGRKIPLYCKELPRFKILDRNDSTQITKFDLVTSFYDSLNYILTEQGLKTTFKSVHKHLNDKGWFIFDMNTPESLKTLWDENSYSGSTDEMAWIWRNEYLPKQKKAKCHATFFKKSGKLWERFEEVHTERAYSNTMIKKLLRESGFVVKGFYHCFKFNKPTRDTYRICAVARKK